MKPATSELVTVAWVKSIAGIAPNGMVSTTLPADNTSWAASGFVKVGPAVGGSPGMYVPLRQPVVQIDTYAVNLNSENPPWDKASNLAELVFNATYDMTLLHGLDTRTGYEQARVVSVTALTEPRRLYDDVAARAHYQLDIDIKWVAL